MKLDFSLLPIPIEPTVDASLTTAVNRNVAVPSGMWLNCLSASDHPVSYCLEMTLCSVDSIRLNAIVSYIDIPDGVSIQGMWTTNAKGMTLFAHVHDNCPLAFLHAWQQWMTRELEHDDVTSSRKRVGFPINDVLMLAVTSGVSSIVGRTYPLQ